MKKTISYVLQIEVYILGGIFMKFEIDIEEDDLDLILTWLGCQDNMDTHSIIMDHQLNINPKRTDAALSNLFLELRDKSPIELKYQKIKNDKPESNYCKNLLKEIKDRYEIYKKLENNKSELAAMAREQHFTLLHSAINIYNSEIRR